MASFEEALDSSSCDADIMSEVIRQLAHGNHRNDCLRMLGACADKYPRSPERWWLYATTLLEDGLTADQRKKALEAVDKVLKVKPERSADAVERLGSSGLTTEALELARLMIEKGPIEGIVDVLGPTFGILSKQGKFTEMDRLAQVAAKRAGSNSDMLTSIALAAVLTMKCGSRHW